MPSSPAAMGLSTPNSRREEAVGAGLPEFKVGDRSGCRERWALSVTTEADVVLSFRDIFNCTLYVLDHLQQSFAVAIFFLRSQQSNKFGFELRPRHSL